jgi:hypothetical protein
MPAQPMQCLGDAETANDCLWFCEHFMDCIMSIANWKLKSRNKRLSEQVTCSLEAFAALMCHNQRWAVDTVNDDGATDAAAVEASNNDDISALSGLTPKKGFMFAVEFKGARKHEGWNNEGMAFHDDLLALVEKQRGHPGCTFEHDHSVALSEQNNKGRGRIGTENQPLQIRNQVDELMPIVGV